MLNFIKNHQKLAWILLVIVFTIPVCWNLIRPGFFSMQDDLQAFRIQQLDKCLSDFQIPCRWVPDAGYRYGYPQFNYYPPSVYYVGAVLHRMGFQYIDAVKILFVLGYVLSALAMYILIESLLGSWPAFVSSILYTYVPYKAVEVYVRGAMSEFWALTLFPLIFWSIVKGIKTKDKKYFLLFSIFLALLLTTHNLMTLIFAPVAIVWTIYWVVIENNQKSFSSLRPWSDIVWSGLLGLGLASFFTLPVVFEKQLVHVESMLGGYFDYRAHFVSLYKLFISREWGYGSSGFPNELLNLSTGFVQWIIGLITLLIGIKVFKRNRKFSILIFLLVFLEIFVLFMIHMKSSFIWAKLPVLWWLQFPWRFLSLSIFLLSILGGFFVYFFGKYKYFLGIIIVFATIILNINYFKPKDWLNISDIDKFSGISWQKQMTISIFDYLPISATLPPINEAPLLPEVLDGKATFRDYVKGSNFQKGKVSVSSDATIRLPLFDFPGMKVKVNGKHIEQFNNDCRNQNFCYGLITFKLNEGEYIIDVRLTDTPIRKIGNILTVISFFVLIFIFLKIKKVVK